MWKISLNRRTSVLATAAAMAALLVPAIATIGAGVPELADAPASTVAVDAPMQAAITAFASADNNAARDAALARLQIINQDHATAFVQQLVVYAAGATSTRAAASAGALVAELHIPDSTMVASTVPLLEATDPAIRRQAGDVLCGYEGASADRAPDYSPYREILADAVAAGEPLPAGLVEHLYANAPGAALRTLMRAVQTREPQRLKYLLWAEHVIADALWRQEYGFLKASEVTPEAAIELGKLAADPAWWVRLYAVEIMKQHPAFRDADILARLLQDDNRLVRQIAAQIQKQD